MNQTGKMSAEPPRIENKHNFIIGPIGNSERRRGAAGRAAVLRRAPSDSDCSGETASLSADSGERTARQQLPPLRTGKANRRRGSEWEVLEGLKDGQRFDKRPDVFNGYLHKKRKWPLKGWHKRFFVVDGGILVYARSPADVARGRLHGSVDVGLSVISAKARRRRIDIDADEFIYHLRAKTPEVFRTWLNVLKAHRLYRQHLLTFGARESVPKIHAPNDDLPATDTSSRTSNGNSDFTSNSEEQNKPQSDPNSPSCTDPFIPIRKDESPVIKVEPKSLIPLNSETLKTKDLHLKSDNKLYKTRGSLCSMKCISKKFINRITKKKSLNVSLNSTETEQQIICTDLTSLKSNIPDLKNTSFNGKSPTHEPNAHHINNKKPTTTFYFITNKENNSLDSDSFQIMKRSKKCTNLVKYKNLSDEPPLKQPSSKCLLLGNGNIFPQNVVPSKNPERLTYQRYREQRHMELAKCRKQAVACETSPKEVEEVEVQIGTTVSKLSQNLMTETDYDKLTEDLMLQVFHCGATTDRKEEVRFYIDRVIKDLYEFKADQVKQPVRALFRCLLEYWLKNTSIKEFNNAMTSVKSTNKQSNVYFTRDEKCSGVDLLKVEKETQFRGFYDVIKRNKPKLTTMTPTRAVEKRSSTSNIVRSPKRDTGSFEKERRIQELERLLKNTVYLCDTRRNSMCREKDIKITKKLIDNIDRRSHEFDILPPNENLPLEKSSSSTELPKIQETINNLISDTAIPADVAKLFLGAYLDVLLYDKSSTTTSQSSDWSTQSKKMPTVDVVTEAVIKKVSKSISTNKAPENQNKMQGLNCNVDPGEVYLKDVLENITTIFPNDKSLDECWQNEKKPEPKTKDDKYDNTVKDELGTAVVKSSKMNLIYENCEENCLVIDLSSYNLEHIAMFHDRKSKDMISITIRLKEKPRHHGESAQAHLNLKFSDDQNSRLYDVNKADDWLCLVNDHTPSADIFNKNSSIKNQPSIYAEKELKELKPYLCASDATSKAYHGIYGSSIVDSKTDSLKQTVVDMNDDNQCYLMSIKKGRVASTVQLKRNVKTRENILKSRETSISNTRIEKPEELTVFEKPAPRIIDEKFILLLLENLMLLSKNVPTLYKDINNLHLKLRKKYEKVIKNSCNIQGLSLLGKIYNEDNLKCTENKATQYESNVCTETITIDNRKCIATNTFTLKSDKTITTDIDIQSFISLNKSKEPIQRTLNMKKHNINNFIPSTSKKETIVTETETVSITCVDVAISVQNWTEITKECEIKTLGKYFFENGPSSNCTRITRPIAYFDQIRKRKLPMKFRQQLRDLSLLGSCNKKSTQSQTDNACGGNKRFDKDFNIYQLYLCKKYSLKASSSEINVEYVKNDDVKTLYRCSSGPSFNSGLLSPTSTAMRGPQASFVSGTPGGRLASWIIESGGPLENASRELGQAQLSVQQLQRLLEALELQQQVHHDTDVSLEGASPNVKKDRRKFGLRKKKSNSKCASVELQPPHIDPSSSHTALSALTAPPSPGGGASSVPNSAASLPIACAAARPQSLPGAESLATAPGPASLTSLTPDHQMREDFTVLAKDLVTSLKGIVSTLVCERGRLRAAMEAAEASPGSGMVAALTNNLTTALHQNSELRSRLSRIHDASDIAEICSVGNNSDAVARQFQQSLSYSSSCVSASEFFDAEEHDDDDLKNDDVIPADEAGVIELDGDSSSEAGSLTSEEGSASSDNSDGKASVASAEAITLRAASEPAEGGWARRTRLPAPRPQAGGPSLWNLLYKNIGKDLSQISMPVTINEPLNMLQRLCEELEYCELLDRAAGARCGVERAALVAAFAVSAYAAAAHRAASKPFNPLLAETYECVRDDKGFKFLAEQVSHHPPISACHAESARWCFWQEARIKTKFWGKSMEFQPTGKVHVQLRTTGDHYTWNKVTTCVHNLFGGQRWVDQYGDMHISCVGTDITCKLSFIKASSWSHSRHEVRGAVVSGRGQRLRLAGRWSEALYAGEPPAARCLWRPGAMPPEHEMYYGFTRFAMELNEMEPGMKEILPHTDTRFRPDQRALEEGDVDTAETFKHDLEQAQRERRRDNVHHTPAWFRKTLEDGEETWVFSGEYWKVRENGFPEDIAPRIW